MGTHGDCSVCETEESLLVIWGIGLQELVEKFGMKRSKSMSKA